MHVHAVGDIASGLYCLVSIISQLGIAGYDLTMVPSLGYTQGYIYIRSAHE